MKRIFAWAGIFVIAAAFLALVFFTLTGAPANRILAVLVCLLILPVLFYGLSIFAKLRKDRRDGDEDRK